MFFACVNSIGRVVSYISCVVCCAWCVVAYCLIGVDLDFSTKFCSNFLCILLRRVHNFLYFLTQNPSRNGLGHLGAILGLHLEGFFWAARPKWASWEALSAILGASGRP